jgi:hypothetical protein
MCEIKDMGGGGIRYRVRHGGISVVAEDACDPGPGGAWYHAEYEEGCAGLEAREERDDGVYGGWKGRVRLSVEGREVDGPLAPCEESMGLPPRRLRQARLAVLAKTPAGGSCGMSKERRERTDLRGRGRESWCCRGWR